MAVRSDPFEGTRSTNSLAVWAAFLAVCVIWGSTYLAIRVTIETIPPLLSAAFRFLTAGVVLYVLTIRLGDAGGDRPRLVHWRSALVIGAAMLFGGNGLVSVAEQRVPSGIASLIIATVPLWMVAIRGAFLRERVRWVEVVGLVIGFGGIALLVDPFGHGGADLVGVGTLLLAAICWAGGSLYARRAALPSRPLVGTAMQMLAGGVVLLVVGTATGEWGRFDPGAVSLESLLALAYLIVFGSLVAFASYVWLLRNARTTFVSTYAYVNPVVAVFLGWAVLDEIVTGMTLLAGAVIVAAVALIVSAGSRAKRAPEPGPALPERQRLSA
jgi:drug/metabolite transporter (DMT)-like permease